MLLRNQVAWKAIVKADEIISPQDTSGLHNIQNTDLPFFKEKENQLVLPYEKNIHYLEAVENSSFIDVILPNYDMVKRRCDYYMEVDPTKKPGERSIIYYSYPDDGFDMNIVDFKGELVTD